MTSTEDTLEAEAQAWLGHYDGPTDRRAILDAYKAGRRATTPPPASTAAEMRDAADDLADALADASDGTVRPLTEHLYAAVRTLRYGTDGGQTFPAFQAVFASA